ncbi:MAG: hypothetical protein LUE98_17635 [Tannerellaceae bacterium]|nr:hypothetical protein [Tannerellaceae bacterium]
MLQEAKQEGGGNPDPEKPFIAALSSGVSAETFDNYFIGVKTNVSDWTIELEENAKAWLKAEIEGDGFVISTLSDNNTGEDRITDILLLASLNGEEDFAVVTISQISKVVIPAPYIKAPSAFTFDKSGGEELLEIETNDPNWQSTVSGSADWLTVGQDGNQLKLGATPFEEEGKHTAIVILLATSEDGRFSNTSIEVTQYGLNAPKLELTIIIDDEIVEVVPLGYKVENPLTDDPKITTHGFTDGETFTIKKRGGTVVLYNDYHTQ